MSYYIAQCFGICITINLAMVISMAAKHGSISPVTPGNYSLNFCHSSAVHLAKRPGIISVSVILHPYLKISMLNLSPKVLHSKVRPLAFRHRVKWDPFTSALA
jgi:hypothetical protein